MCVVVGGGKVAARKCEDLLEAGAHIAVISPTIDPRFEALLGDSRITVEGIVYTSGILTRLKPLLVFAATNDPQVNRQVATDARVVGALVDTVDEYSADPIVNDFSSMATIRRGPITIGIATGGASPALAAHLRKRLEAVVGPEYGQLAEALATHRNDVRARISSEADRRQLWQTIIDSPALDLFLKGSPDAANAVIQEIIAAFLTGKPHT